MYYVHAIASGAYTIQRTALQDITAICRRNRKVFKRRAHVWMCVCGWRGYGASDYTNREIVAGEMGRKKTMHWQCHEFMRFDSSA